jgi:hypothetical protein
MEKSRKRGVRNEEERQERTRRKNKAEEHEIKGEEQQGDNRCREMKTLKHF